jgi:transcriptional regulator with XRE-family HTH domain
MPDPIYKHIGSVIKRRRKQLEMKQFTLAGLLAISRGSLANIETGRQSILVHQLYNFARELQLSPNDLLPPIADSSSVDDWAGQLPQNLNAKQQEQIVRFLDDAHPEPTVRKRERNVKPAKQ